MRKSAIRGIILQKITEYYSATGTATTVKQLAMETGFRPQNINRMVKSMAKAKQLTIIGGDKRRQVKYLLPMDALVAPGFFRLAAREKVKGKKREGSLRDDYTVIALAALQLSHVFDRKLAMSQVESYLIEMENNPTESWKSWIGIA